MDGMGIFAAEEMVAPGGTSAPVWAFSTAVVSLLIVNVFQLLSARTAAKEAAVKVEAVQASTDMAVYNTKNVGNGFARDVNTKLDVIYTAVQDIEQRFTDHLEWHLQQEGIEHHGTHAEQHGR
jgi:hypothetical protein